MKKHYLFLLLILTCFGCKKQVPDGSSDATPVVTGTGLPGTWELRYSVSGLTGYKINYPAGNAHLMVFTTEGYQTFDNGVLVHQGTYTLTQQHSYLLNRVADCIIFDNSSTATLIDLNGNQVSFALDANDGGASGYERIK
jgi:hypothetical protein